MSPKARYKFYRSLVRTWGRRKIRGLMIPADRARMLRAGRELWKMEVACSRYVSPIAMRVVPDSLATRYKLMAHLLRSPSQITGL